MVNSQTESSGLFNLVRESSSMRLGLFFILYVFVQLMMLLQKPFINPKMMFGMYICAAIFFGAELLFYATQVQKKYSVYVWQLCFLFLFFYFANQWSSLFLFFILSFLFISGFQVKLMHSLLLGCIASVLYSVLNAIALRLDGAHNALSLILFNCSFLTISFLSSYFAIDIQQLKKNLVAVEKKLISKAELAQTLMQNMPVQVFAFDSRNKMIFSNQNQSEIIAQENFVRRIVEQKKLTQELDVRYFDPNEKSEKYFNVDHAQYFDADLNETIELILLRDQTERVKLIEALRQKEKLAAIGQLAAGIAHEIRNPLAGISGSVELLSKETNSADDKKLMNIILKEINRLNNLITEFLEYARPEKKPDQIVDLSFLLNEVIENVRQSSWIPKNTQFKVSLTTAARVLGVSDKLKQAFLNIVVNAVQAMLQCPEPVLEVELSEKDTFVVVKIKDVGVGMSNEVKSRVFEPFFTTKHKGTGLGMALTHKILEMHQVKVDIDSEPGHGTTFLLTFNRLTS